MLNNKMLSAVLVGGLLIGGGNAVAAPDTTDGNGLTAVSPSCFDAVSMIFDDCSGAWSGNNKNQPNDVAAEIASQGWGNTILNTYDVSAGGPSSDVLNFSPISGPFVIALKASDQFSLYYYSNTGGTSSLFYDTIGTSVNKRGIAQDLSHATIYTLVPEPETYAMLLAGLGLVGFTLRKQKRY